MEAFLSGEAVDRIREKGIKVGMIRPITLWPFPKDIFSRHSDKQFLVVEMSEGQLIEDVKLATGCSEKISFLGHGGGWYPDTGQIIEKIEKII